MSADLRIVPAPELPCEQCAVGIGQGVGSGGHCHFAHRDVRAGELVYDQGEAAASVWLVKRGQVALERAGQHGDPAAHAHALRGPGDFLGLEALVQEHYADRARALQPLLLCGARREHFDRWLGPRSAPARAALEQVLRAAAADVPRAASADGGAVRRVARWLVSESESGREPALPRRMLADLLGMVPETLSRALAELRKQGAIGPGRQQKIQILDREALRSAAGS